MRACLLAAQCQSCSSDPTSTARLLPSGAIAAVLCAARHPPTQCDGLLKAQPCPNGYSGDAPEFRSEAAVHDAPSRHHFAREFACEQCLRVQPASNEACQPTITGLVWAVLVMAGGHVGTCTPVRSPRRVRYSGEGEGPELAPLLTPAHPPGWGGGRPWSPVSLSDKRKNARVNKQATGEVADARSPAIVMVGSNSTDGKWQSEFVPGPAAHTSSPSQQEFHLQPN